MPISTTLESVIGIQLPARTRIGESHLNNYNFIVLAETPGSLRTRLQDLKHNLNAAIDKEIKALDKLT